MEKLRGRKQVRKLDHGIELIIYSVGWDFCFVIFCGAINMGSQNVRSEMDLAQCCVLACYV